MENTYALFRSGEITFTNPCECIFCGNLVDSYYNVICAREMKTGLMVGHITFSPDEITHIQVDYLHRRQRHK